MANTVRDKSRRTPLRSPPTTQYADLAPGPVWVSIIECAAVLRSRPWAPTEFMRHSIDIRYCVAHNGTCKRFGSLSRPADTGSARHMPWPPWRMPVIRRWFPARSETLDDRLVFVGVDDRGVELEIVAIQLPGFLYIIHVMPTQFRR
jgi:hypothetical protein